MSNAEQLRFFALAQTAQAGGRLIREAMFSVHFAVKRITPRERAGFS